MKELYTLETLKDEAVLIELLEKVWKAGCLARGYENISYEEAIRKYMPDFKKQLSA